MAAIDDSPVGSPLSELSSDDFAAEEEHDRLAAEALMPPAKRQKLGNSSSRATPTSNHPEEDAGYISSDTDGEVPNSPTNLRPEDDDTHEQVTICAWMGCDAGDIGNMDKLVEHVHDEHIETRQKKYTCEWSDCTRRSMPHASGYALKAHMRSHTREKPFYCALPECDRAFTRSDALAKHMRTVHETEALRPSDPIPKSMQPIIKPSRLKLSIKPQQPQNGAPHPLNGITNGNDPPGWTSSYPAELGFTAEEETRGSKDLYRLLRRQVHWADEEGKSLEKQCEEMERLRKKEWLDKEVLLEQVIRNESSWHERREEILRQMEYRILPNFPPKEETTTSTAALSPPPADGPSPEKPVEEAAAVLASLHQA